MNAEKDWACQTKICDDNHLKLALISDLLDYSKQHSSSDRIPVCFWYVTQTVVGLLIYLERGLGEQLSSLVKHTLRKGSRE
ncbi:hypothetical protein AAC387_Pa06g2303 [Persea americana]